MEILHFKWRFSTLKKNPQNFRKFLKIPDPFFFAPEFLKFGQNDKKWTQSPLLKKNLGNLQYEHFFHNILEKGKKTTINTINTIKWRILHFRTLSGDFFDFEKGAELFWVFFFFRDFFFFLVGGGFGAVQAPFWENPGVKGRFVRVLGHLGVVLELSRLRSGETSGEMQVPSRFGHKKLLKKANCPVHFCFLCVFIYVDVCDCLW